MESYLQFYRSIYRAKTDWKARNRCCKKPMNRRATFDCSCCAWNETIWLVSHNRTWEHGSWFHVQLREDLNPCYVEVTNNTQGWETRPRGSTESYALSQWRHQMFSFFDVIIQNGAEVTGANHHRPKAISSILIGCSRPVAPMKFASLSSSWLFLVWLQNKLQNLEQKSQMGGTRVGLQGWQRHFHVSVECHWSQASPSAFPWHLTSSVQKGQQSCRIPQPQLTTQPQHQMANVTSSSLLKPIKHDRVPQIGRGGSRSIGVANHCLRVQNFQRSYVCHKSNSYRTNPASKKTPTPPESNASCSSPVPSKFDSAFTMFCCLATSFYRIPFRAGYKTGREWENPPESNAPFRAGHKTETENNLQWFLLCATSPEPPRQRTCVQNLRLLPGNSQVILHALWQVQNHH